VNILKPMFVVLGAAVIAVPAVVHAGVDADAAKALIKKSNCGKCHSLDKKKDGPSFRETAKKYRGKADAEHKLYLHLTTRPKVKVDGKEEEHTTLKSKKEADVKNVVHWILAQ